MPDFYIDSNSLQDDSDATWNSSTLSFLTTAAYIADAGSAVGDNVWYASDHLEQTAANTTLTYYDKSVLISVNSTTDAFEKGARVETTTGLYDLNIVCSNLDGGQLNFDGVYFAAGDDLKPNTRGVKYIFNNPKFELLSTTNGDVISLFGDGIDITFNDGEIKLNSTNQDVFINGGSIFKADNLTITAPAGHDHVFDMGSDGGARLRITNSDLSGATITGELISQTSDADDIIDIYMSRVLVGAGYDVINDTTRTNRYVNLYSVGTADEYYNLNGSFREGDIDLSESVVRNATYYSTSKFSLKFSPNSNVVEFVNPLRYQLKAPLLDLSAGAKTLTVHIHLQDSAGTPTSLTDKNTKLVAHYADGTDLALGLTVTSNPTIDIVDSATALSTVTADFTGAGLSGTYKQHTISLIIPQNTATGMDEAIVELWLELSTELAGTTEMFVDPDPVVS